MSKKNIDIDVEMRYNYKNLRSNAESAFKTRHEQQVEEQFKRFKACDGYKARKEKEVETAKRRKVHGRTINRLAREADEVYTIADARNDFKTLYEAMNENAPSGLSNEEIDLNFLKKVMNEQRWVVRKNITKDADGNVTNVSMKGSTRYPRGCSKKEVDRRTPKQLLMPFINNKFVEKAASDIRIQVGKGQPRSICHTAKEPVKPEQIDYSMSNIFWKTPRKVLSTSDVKFQNNTPDAQLCKAAVSSLKHALGSKNFGNPLANPRLGVWSEMNKAGVTLEGDVSAAAYIHRVKEAVSGAAKEIENMFATNGLSRTEGRYMAKEARKNLERELTEKVKKIQEKAGRSTDVKIILDDKL